MKILFSIVLKTTLVPLPVQEIMLLVLLVKTVNEMFFHCNRLLLLLLLLDCEYGTLRLIDGSTVSEGTLQICNYNSWGLISSTGWNDADTVVACTELGYDSESRYILIIIIIIIIIKFYKISNMDDIIMCWENDINENKYY